MTIEQLRDKLVAAVVDNALPLTEAATGVAGIGASIEAQLGLAKLSIAGDGAPPSITIGGDGTFVLAEGKAHDGSGGATVLGITDALLRCFFTLTGPASDTVQFSLAVTTPTAATPWTFGTSFPPLEEDSVFSFLEIKARPFLIVTSYVHPLTGYNPDAPDQTFPDLLADALNVQAETNFGTPFQKLPGPLSTSKNLLFQGSVSDRSIPLMLLIADSGKDFTFGDIVSIKNIRYYAESLLVVEPPVNDEFEGGGEIDAEEESYTDVEFEVEDEDGEENDFDPGYQDSGLDALYKASLLENGEDDESAEEDVAESDDEGDEVQYSRAGVLARVASLFGTSPALELNSEVPTEGKIVTLAGDFDEGHQPSLADMTGFLFGSSLTLPAPLQSIFSNLKLAGFGLQFNFDTTTLLQVSITSIYDAPIQVLPGTDYLTFSDLRFLWSLSNPLSSPKLTLGIDGVVTVLGTGLAFTAAMPAYVLTGGLNEGETIVVDIPALLDHVGLPKNLLPELTVTEMNFSAAPTQMAYALSAEVAVEKSWGLVLGPITFACTSFAFAVEYSFGVITGELEFKVLIQGFNFFVKGEYTGEEDGWIITGGLPEGDTLPLVPFAASYLPFTVVVPESLAALSITQLLVTFNTGPGTYAFLGALEWPLDMFPGSPKITAAVSIKNEKEENGNYITSGKVEGTLQIYGLKISASYTFKPDSTVIAFKLDYEGRTLSCGIESTPNKTVLTASLGNVTFGDILQFLVGLVLPGYRLELGAPWDLLNKISFDGLALRVTREQKNGKMVQTIGIEYPININLGFFQLTKIGLTVLDGAQGSTVRLDMYGSMLGKDYEKEPLSWDTLNDPAPTVPGEGDALLDLRYLAIGQNVALRDARTFNTLQEALDSLQDFKPVSGNDTNPLAAQEALVYSGNGSWLIGADFTIMGTVSLGVIFNDPQLYGLRVALSGEKAKSLAGLSFEILYKKVTDTIGVYQIELKLPDAIRQLQFGAISLTIPIISVAIYTNGNFRVDMGFPQNRDFSKSFCIQVWPFIGYGGFYFAVLSGATSSRVPKISNGTFSPVIEFGIGLSVGLGKTLDYGILKAGLSLTVEGITEGVLAWFNPTDTSQPSDTYFWLQGTVAVVGKLYGTVDFVIIKADVNLTASASITLTIEAYAPIDVYLQLKVEVEVSVKILFFTVNLSFKMTLDFSFTVGTASTPPWRLDSSQPPRVQSMMLRQQKMANHRRVLVAVRNRRRRLLLAVSAAQAGGFNWTPVPVFGGVKMNIPLSMVPNMTVATPTGLHSVRLRASAANASIPGMPQVEMVMSLFVENSAPPGTSQAARRMARKAPEQAPFNWIVTGMLLWSIGALDRPDRTVVNAADLELIMAELDKASTKAEAFSYANLSGLLDLNYRMKISTPLAGPTGMTGITGVSGSGRATRAPQTAPEQDGPVGLVGTASAASGNSSKHGISDSLNGLMHRSSLAGGLTASATGATGATGAPAPMQSATIFPMIPDLVMAPQDAPTIDFATFNPVSPKYEENLDAYFKQLLVNYESNVAKDPFAAPDPPAPLKAGPEEGNESMATFIFRDYFAMVAKSAVQAATDFLKQYPYQVQPNDSLCTIARNFGPTGMECFSELLLAAASLNAAAAAAITVEAIGEANAAAPLAVGATLNVSGVLYQILTADSFKSITTKLFLTPDDLPAFFEDPAGNVSNAALLSVGAVIAIPNPQLGHVPAVDWYKKNIIELNPGVDLLSLPLPLDTIVIPIASFAGGEPVPTDSTTSYAIVENDTLDIIARYFCMVQMLAAGLPWCQPPVGDCSARTISLPGTSQAASVLEYTIRTNDTFRLISDLFCVCPADIALANFTDDEMLVPLAVMQIPTIAYKVRQNDTITSVAAFYDLTVDELAYSIRLDGGIFPDGSTVIVPDVPELNVADLAASLMQGGTFDSIATMVSNFLLHGLRVPNPADSSFLDQSALALRASESTPVNLWGLYEIVGQQFTAPELGTPLYDIEFTKNGTAQWVNFAEDATALNVKLTAADIKENYPATTFNPKILSGPEPLKLYREMPRRWSLQKGIHWQSASPVPLPTGATGPTGLTGPASQGAGQPSIWLFPDTLAAALAPAGPTGPTRITRPYELVETRRTPGSGQTERTLEHYSWGTAVELGIRRITSDGGPSTQNAYLMLGADEAGRKLLQEAWSFLNARSRTENATLYVLYPPNAVGANPSGLASDTIRPESTFLLKTNLSSITHSGPAPLFAAKGLALPPSGDYYSQISDANAFIKYLWECSIVGTGGYYFNYLNAAGGTGLPSDLFSNGDEAKIWLLIVLDSQRRSKGTDRNLYSFNNCAVMGDQFDATVANIYAQLRGATGQELMKIATVPPGNIGFRMTRRNPEETGITGPVGRTESLYNLLGYAVQPNDFFAASNEALPIGPSTPEGSTGATGPVPWEYQHVVPVAQFGNYNSLPGGDCLQGPTGMVVSVVDPLPARIANPYAGITGPAPTGTGPASRVTLGFAFHDIYGNQIEPATPVGPISVTVGYTDPIIPLAAWPGAASEYLFTRGTAGANPTAVLSWLVNLQVDKYMPGPAADLTAALYSATTDVQRYKQIYYQIAQRDLEFGLRTSLDQASPTAEARRYPVQKRPLANFASSAYIFLQTIQSLKQYIHEAAGTETLGGLAAMFSADPGALVEANKTSSTEALFTGSVIHPEFHVAGPDDSLASIADGRTGSTAVPACPPPETPLTPAMLAENNSTAPLTPGAVVHTATRTFTVPHDITLANDTLAAIAASQRCTVGYQFGTGSLPGEQSGIVVANFEVGAILQPGLPITIENITITTDDASTFKKLLDAFIARGLTLSVVQFAVAIQDAEGIFIPGVTISLDDYVIQQGGTFGTIPAEMGTIADLATRNAAVTNLFATGTAVYVSYTCDDLSPLPIEEILTNQWRISYTQFAAFNGSTALAAGAKFTIPNLARLEDTAGELYVPYGTRGTETIASIATLFGTNPLSLATADAYIPGIFVTTAPIKIGDCSVTPTVDSTICTLYDEFAACSPGLSFEDFVSAISGMPGIIANGAILAPPVPGVPSVTGDIAGLSRSLAWVAEQFNVLTGNAQATVVSPEVLAVANSALDGLLRQGATVRLSASATHTLDVKEHDTFISLVYRFKTELDIDTSVAAIAAANSDLEGLLRTGSPFVLPPNPILMAQEITPNVPGTIFPITVSLELRRSIGMVAPDFTGTPSVITASSQLAPQATPAPDGTQSLVVFAERFENAFRIGAPPNTLKLKAALGKNENAFGQQAAEPKLWAVNFGDQGISRFDIGRNFPGFHALAPLSTELASGTVPVYEYVSGQGLTNRGFKTFQSVDVDLWMREFLGTMDLFLAPAYSVPAFQLGADGSFAARASESATSAASLPPTPTPAPSTALPDDGPMGLVGRGQPAAAVTRSTAFNAVGALGITGGVQPGRTSYEEIVDAKERIAAQLMLKVQPILTLPGSDPYLEAAREALRQQMLITLSSAYAVDAVVSYPVDVKSSFTRPPAPRVSGPIVPKPYTVSTDSTLANAAAMFGVSTPYFAQSIVTGSGIIRPGLMITYRNGSYCTKEGDTLFVVALAFGVDPVIADDRSWREWSDFIAAIDVLHPLCLPIINATADNYPLILANSSFDLGAIARRITASDTIDTIAAYLNVAVPEFARANEDVQGLFHAGARIPYCAEIGIDSKCARQETYQVLPNQTLAEIVDAINALAAVPVTVESIALELAGMASLLSTAATARGLQPQTESSFSTVKVDLENGALPPLISLFSIKQRSRYKKAFFDLGYVINELEYDIADVQAIAEYQASSWLSFLIPIGSAGDTAPVVNTSIGQVEIPLPLRAYPAPPSMVHQNGFASLPDASTIADARRWTYEFTYESRNAAQDTTYLNVAFGGVPNDQRTSNGGVDPRVFAALAQFMNVYPGLLNDLSILPQLAPGAASLTAQVAVAVLAATAQGIASALEPNFKLTATPSTQPKQSYDFRVETAADAQQALLETLTLDLLSYSGPTGPGAGSKVGVTGPPGGWPDIFVKGPVGVTGPADGFLPLTPALQTATEASYVFPPDIQADASLTLMYSFPMRDIVMNQDGSAGVYLTRNQDLISSGPLGPTGPVGPFPTNKAFVYRTPMVRFVDRTVPFIFNQSEITIACIPFGTVSGAIAASGLSNCIMKMFNEMLGIPSGAHSTGVHTISLAVSYGYRLAQPTQGSNAASADIIARVPILFRPTFDYDSNPGFIDLLAEAIEMWTKANDPNPDGGFYLFDITLLTRVSGATGPASPTGPPQPILRLDDVRIPLAATGPRSPGLGRSDEG